MRTWFINNVKYCVIILAMSHYVPIVDGYPLHIILGEKFFSILPLPRPIACKAGPEEGFFVRLHCISFVLSGCVCGCCKVALGRAASSLDSREQGTRPTPRGTGESGARTNTLAHCWFLLSICCWAITRNASVDIERYF